MEIAKEKWYDGIIDLYNSLANNRNATKNNKVSGERVLFPELNEIYKTGLGNKIVRVKTGYALKSSNMNFSSKEDKAFYIAKLESKVKEAFMWSLVFGRGIIVINDGGDLSEPLVGEINKQHVRFNVFSGDMVSVVNYNRDLSSARYYQPESYTVRGENFHHSRVIDLTYIKLTEDDKPTYNFGGISEFELIYSQIINDGIVERASSSILEKNSSLFYKIKGFKKALESKQESNLVKFYRLAEDRRSIHGAGLIDSEDDVVNVAQSLTNLKDADDISLRRISLVSGIPLPMLVGESVGGLNSTGDQEKTSFNEMIEILQQDYIVSDLNSLFSKLGMAIVTFKDNQNVTPLEKVDYETKVIDNAVKLNDMGYDAESYMKDRSVDAKSRDDFESEFSLLDDVEEF